MTKNAQQRAASPSSERAKKSPPQDSQKHMKMGTKTRKFHANPIGALVLVKNYSETALFNSRLWLPTVAQDLCLGYKEAEAVGASQQSASNDCMKETLHIHMGDAKVPG